MEIVYRKEMGNNYLVIKAGMHQNEYAYRIISENKIDGLLPVSASFVNGSADYYYEINGKTSLKNYFAKRGMTYDDIKNILLAAAKIPCTLDEYLLNRNHISISPETVFINSLGNDVSFVFFPDEKGDYEAGIREITTFFLSKIDHQDQKLVSATYGAFEIASRDNFAMEEISKLFGEEENLDEGFSDDLLKFDENEYNFEIPDDDIFASDEQMEEEHEELLEYEEKVSIIDKIKGYGFIIPSIIGMVLAGLFLFVTPAASSMSLAIKIVCFVMFSVAMALVGILLKSRKTAEK